LLQPRLMTGQEERSLDVTVLDLGELTSQGLNDESLEALRAKLSVSSESPKCVVGLITSANADKIGIDSILRKVPELRHPGALVLAGLPGGWDLSETIINSLNEESKGKYRHSEFAGEQHFEVWDPVLVLGSGNRFAWVGAEENTRCILDALVNSGGLLTDADLCGLLLDETVLAEVLRTLRNDRHLIRIHDNGNVQLLPTLTAIAKGVCKCISNRLREARKLCR
jgi:hypothetical protein